MNIKVAAFTVSESLFIQNVRPWLKGQRSFLAIGPYLYIVAIVSQGKIYLGIFMSLASFNI